MRMGLRRKLASVHVAAAQFREGLKMTDDIKFIESIRKQGKHAEDNLAMCDVLHLIKMVADGDLRHVDEPMQPGTRK